MLRRVRLRLIAPLGTPMVSGTLFGHLCWAYLDRKGEAALVAWLHDMATGKRPPFLISDAFVAGWLPRPLLPSRVPDAEDPEQARRHKQLRKSILVRREDFLKLREQPTTENDWLERCSLAAPAPWLVRHAHNVIDRLRNTTPERAGLWFIDDDWSFARWCEREVYVDCDLEDGELRELFALIGACGYGRDTTYGRGLFEVVGVCEDAELAKPLSDGDVRLMSLSHGCLSANMADARWRRTTHFGKLAARIDNGRPWKKPLLLMRPGATFRPTNAGPFGALLDQVHRDLPHVRFNAWHLCIAYREAAL